jgi:hypothetical protein
VNSGRPHVALPVVCSDCCKEPASQELSVGPPNRVLSCTLECYRDKTLHTELRHVMMLLIPSVETFV